jgi:hypothetical protein
MPFLLQLNTASHHHNAQYTATATTAPNPTRFLTALPKLLLTNTLNFSSNISLSLAHGNTSPSAGTSLPKNVHDSPYPLPNSYSNRLPSGVARLAIS